MSVRKITPHQQETGDGIPFEFVQKFEGKNVTDHQVSVLGVDHLILEQLINGHSSGMSSEGKNRKLRNIITFYLRGEG